MQRSKGTVPPWSPCPSFVCRSSLTVSSSGISYTPLRSSEPCCPVGPPLWDLVKVLTYLCGSTFEPLASNPLRLVTMKVSSLMALVTAKRVGELHALSCWVASHGRDISLAYLPEFVAKTKTASKRNPLTRSFLVRSLEEFVGDLPEECLLCPVLAIMAYLSVIASISPHPRALLISPKRPSCAVSKNTAVFPTSDDLQHWCCGGGCLAPSCCGYFGSLFEELVGFQVA